MMIPGMRVVGYCGKCGAPAYAYALDSVACQPLCRCVPFIMVTSEELLAELREMSVGEGK